MTLKISLRRLRFASGDFKIKTFAIIIMFKTYFTQWEKRFEFHTLKLDQKMSFNFGAKIQNWKNWRFQRVESSNLGPEELNAKSFEKEINGIYCK